MRYAGETEPALAVSVAAFKRSRHILEEDGADDLAFEAYLRAAQDAVSIATGRPLVAGAYAFTVPVCPAFRRWWFPCAPVTGITEVAIVDPEGEETAVTGARLLRGDDEPQLLMPKAWAQDAGAHDALRLTATCGAATAPERLKQAVILLAGEWFEAGIAAEETVEVPRLSMGALRLIKQSRYRRPGETAQL